jgi:hypothetical protein
LPTYAERLKDPRWQRRRLEILNRSSFTCESCDAGDRTLHVHHKLYRKGAMPWEYADHELEALCEQCHAWLHDRRAALDAAVASLTTADLDRVLGYAETLALAKDGGGFGPNDRLIVRSCEHARGIADASIDWNGAGMSNIADCLCDHRVIDQELHDALGLFSDFGMPEPRRGAA